jgi:hypothetical protein
MQASILNSIEQRERRRILEMASRIAPPSSRTLLIHGAVSGPCLTSVFLFVPFLGQTLAILTLGLMIRLFWVCRSARLPVVWVAGCGVTLAIVGSCISVARTSVEFWLYILFGLSMGGALGSLISAGAILSAHFDKAREALEDS